MRTDPYPVIGSHVGARISVAVDDILVLPGVIKMVKGSRYYRALESVSIASALSSALTIYPCQIRVYQR